ncbi:P-loop containing nucleoside triphosphate hydrolase protein [Lineolata rhizophorae]|uniref:P-loop containing nucleoside triphosphate hydrolase protein n=1 Tax=Lineolata rhizophorae TaxID=578093 RepID=A0A6A6NT93_9PEZI|nr:P-loop containing nucleoside triphosphate hydrolase protein [Lineolata rhizophorae]
MAASSATLQKPTLNVEVRLRNNASSTAFLRTDLIREEVTDWLCKNFLSLKIDQELTGFDSLSHGDVIESIRVVDSSSALDSDASIHRLDETHLAVQAYELHDAEDDPAPRPAKPSVGEENEDEEESPQLRITRLPSKSLNGLWDALVFEDGIPAKLLKYTTRMMAMMRRPSLDMAVVSWNRLLLLHGPPGSGKTTLCRALSQKLAIRLGHHFTQGRLVEVNSQTLLSRWFGESGKLVAKAFESICSVAEDESTLVCVLIDEVETLTGSREKASTGSECGDALRATNQLLTALDRLRYRSNVIVLCTSNLFGAIDSAFLDRVDIKQHVSNPCPKAAYEILRTCINELIRCNVLTPDDELCGTTNKGHTAAAAAAAEEDEETPHSFSDEAHMSDWDVVEYRSIPPLAVMDIHLWDRPDAPARKLWGIAERCAGLSGRALRRLPGQAIALHTHGESCTVAEGLAALSVAVDEELGATGGQ